MDQRQDDNTGNVYEFNGGSGPTAPSAPRGVVEGSGDTVHNDSPSMGNGGAFFPGRGNHHHHPHPHPNRYPPHHNGGGRAYPSRDPYDDYSMRPGGARKGWGWGGWGWGGRGRRDHYHPINSNKHHHHHHSHSSYGGRRGWRSYPRWRTDTGRVNPKACCFFLCFILGFIFIIIGGTWLTSSMDFDKRKEKIEAYNDYVNNWGYYVNKNLHGKTLPTVTMETQVICHNSPGAKANFTLPMNTDITDKITDKNGYEDDALPLKPQYKYTKNMVFKGITPQSCSIEATIFDNHKKLTSKFNVFFAQKTSYQCYWRQSTDPAHDKYMCQQKCAKKGGIFTSETCTYYVSLTDICYKVNIDPYDESLRLDTYTPSVGKPALSNGCFYSEKEQEFMALKYQTGKNNNGDTPLTVTIRYSSDPWLGYMRLTNASGNFGLSVAQKRKFGIGFLAAGGAFLIGSFTMARQKY